MKIAFISVHFGYMAGGAEMNDFNLGSAFQYLGNEVTYFFASDPRLPLLDRAHAVSSERVTMRYWYDWALGMPGVAGKLLRHLFEQFFLKQIFVQKRNVLQEQDLILLTGRPLLSQIKALTPATVLQSVRGVPNRRYFKYYDIANGVIFWGECHADHPPWRLKGISKLMLDPAIDHNFFFPAPPKPELRQDLQDRKKNSVIILYTGRLDPVHQFDQIISACGILIGEGLALRLIVVGGGCMQQALEAQAQRELPEDAFSFLGRRSPGDIGDLLRAADIFVINPKLTNHPIALMEALACGTYALAPRLGRVPKILGPDGFGDMFEPNNQAALTLALRGAIAGRRFDKKANQHTVPRRFESWQDNAEAILDWYIRQLEGTRGNIDHVRV